VVRAGKVINFKKEQQRGSMPLSSGFYGDKSLLSTQFQVEDVRSTLFLFVRKKEFTFCCPTYPQSTTV
jgi:hypothetical protein